MKYKVVGAYQERMMAYLKELTAEQIRNGLIRCVVSPGLSAHLFWTDIGQRIVADMSESPTSANS